MLRRRRNWKSTFAALAFACSAVMPAAAAVTPGGDTTLAATSNSMTYVGKNAVGTLHIDGGSALANTYGYLGYNSGSSGFAIVSGIDSKWTNSESLHVGSSGSGSLTVENGGLVTARTLYASLSDMSAETTCSCSAVPPPPAL